MMTDDAKMTRWAVRIVARHVAASVAEAQIADEWGNYPEVGEDDWRMVVDEAASRVAFPDADQFSKAYAHLESRAEHI